MDGTEYVQAVHSKTLSLMSIYSNYARHSTVKRPVAHFWFLQAVFQKKSLTVKQALGMLHLLCIVGHGDNATDAVASLHVAKGLVDPVERLSVSDELVDLELAGHVVVDEVGELSATLDTTKGATLPHTSGDELECCSRSVSKIRIFIQAGRILTSCADFLASSSNTNDDTLTPALVAGLESAPHNVYVTSAVECVIATTVGHLDKLLLDGLTILQFHGVDKVGGTEFLCPVLLAVVDVHDDNLAGAVLDTTLDDGETNTSGTEDGDVAALLNTTLASSDDGGTVTGGDTAAKQTGAVHWCLVGDWNDGDVGYDSVLGESGGTHEVEEVLALALEA